MTIEHAETDPNVLRRSQNVAYEPLGLRYLDEMAAAAGQYRRAKDELVALRAADASQETLAAATARLASARLAVRRAISGCWTRGEQRPSRWVRPAPPLPRAPWQRAQRPGTAHVPA